MGVALAVTATIACASFIIVSSPGQSKVLYAKLPTFQELATKPEIMVVPQDLLVNLKSPQGLAMYHRDALIISDTIAQEIYMYDLSIAGSILSVVNGFLLVTNVPSGARWLAVDGVGDLFYSVEQNSEIFKVSASAISQSRMTRTSATPVVLYQASSTESVSNPSGISTDNFFLYWGNKESGSSRGSVVSARSLGKAHDDQTYPLKLASNENRVYGVCQVDFNIFYTAPNKFYGVRKSGGAIAIVSDEMLSPRGCTYDGDGSIYIADSGSNAIYKSPAHFASLHPVKRLNKVMDIVGPSQVVFLRSSARSFATLWTLFALFL